MPVRRSAARARRVLCGGWVSEVSSVALGRSGPLWAALKSFLIASSVNPRDRSFSPSSQSRTSARWTHPSVRALLKEVGDDDPVEAVVARARAVVLRALDAGWIGPPFDPIRLADVLGLAIVPSDEVRDARTVPVGGGCVRIEFNPSRPRGRMRYSLAHEIAHTLFSDCAERVRHRAAHAETTGDEWQLEALCNIAAAELLMPVGAVAELADRSSDIDHMLSEQRRFDVSMEALLIRAMRVTSVPCAMFCASRVESGAGAGRYRLDYVIGARHWSGAHGVARGTTLPSDTLIAQCIAIGFTAKGDELWACGASAGAALHVECVGIPPYPGSRHPRVVGVVREAAEDGGVAPAAAGAVTYLRGDALRPRGDGRRLIVHVVNDATANWGGGGFAAVVRREFPDVQSAFREWAHRRDGERRALRLGAVHFAESRDDITVASVVAQHGYGPSAAPRVRYASLHEGLSRAASYAREHAATIHMPRIGCGQAGGAWVVVEELLRETVLASGQAVFVYDPPERAARQALEIPEDLRPSL